MGKLIDLQSKLGVTFTDSTILLSALTHPSHLNENDATHESYQRLEFLGDAVLEFITSEHLYRHFTDIREGKLTEIRAALVRTETLAHCAAKLNLGEYVLLSKGEEMNEGRTNQNILADTFESLMAALYLDQGLDAARKLFIEYVAEELDTIIEQNLHIDPKSRFQELVQSKHKVTPVYKLIKEEPDKNDTVFTMGAYINNKLVGTGKGKNKKYAEHNAAVNALGKIS